MAKVRGYSGRMTEKWLVRIANWDGTASTLNVCQTQAEANAWVHKYSEGEEDAPYYVEHRG